MSISFSRILLFAESDDAAEIANVLAVIAGAASPTWLPFTRRDGTESTAATMRIGDVTVDVVMGRPALPALLEVTVADLAAAAGRVRAAGFSVEAGPHDGDPESVAIDVGGTRITVIAEAALLDRRSV